jgi:hypothetical protein
MGQYTDWFIAKESEAKAVATAENRFKRWPHFEVKGVLDIELMELRRILLGKKKFDPQLDVTGKVLYSKGENVMVFRVVPEFIDELAGLTADRIKKVARTWANIEEFKEWYAVEDKHEFILEVLSEMVTFAKQATAAKQPVLQLVVV